MSAYSSLVTSLSPYLYWRLGASGTTDQSGNGRDGTANGGVTIGGTSSLLSGDTADTATAFDGSNDYVIVTSGTHNMGLATVVLWFQYASAPASQKFVAGFINGLANGTADKDIYLESTGKLTFDAFSGSEKTVTTTSAVSTGVPHMIAGVADGTNIRIYVDGVEAATPTLCGSTFTGYTVPNIFVSGNQATRGFQAFTGDEFAVWNSALTAQNIADLYLYGTNPPLQLPTFRVRELPPLRQSVLVTTPKGNNYRWGEDERKPENVPKSLSYSTTAPGGFETMDCTLPRKTETAYQDLERLSTLTVQGAGGQILAEHRLEKAPRSSGDEIAISPQAVGWQANLDDDAEAMEVYVDRDLTHWDSMSAPRRLALFVAAFAAVEDGSVAPDVTTGIPQLELTISSTGSAAIKFAAESWYDAGPGADVASIYYDYTSLNTLSTFLGKVGTSDDNVGTNTSLTADLLTGTNSSGTGTLTASPATYRFAFAQFQTPTSTAEGDAMFKLRRLTVWGNHNVPKQGTAPNDGVLASDVIADAVSRWAPFLNVTADSITASSFVIPQMEFRDPTTVGDIITQANRFSLDDWFVWNGVVPNQPTFYYHPRGARGKLWRARVGPSKLEQTGPQVDRLFNSAIVTFQAEDGTSRTAGPTGALTDTTSADLLDTDPLNPVNKLGLKRPALLDMGIVSTSDAATEVGKQFLARSKELDHSGSAEIVGHATDDHGVVFPASRIRAGDQIAFTDSADSSYRRVVHTNYDHSSRTNSLDLDSPPEGMAELLERLGVSLLVGQRLPNLNPAATHYG